MSGRGEAQPGTDPATVVRIRPRYRAFPVAGEGLFLVSDDETKFYEGQAFVDLAALLRRGTSALEAAELLAMSQERAVTHYALELMMRDGVLTTRQLDAASGLLDELGLDLRGARDRLDTRPVVVTPLPGTDARPLLNALDSVGIHAERTDEPGPQAVQLVLTTDYLAPELEAIGRVNAEAKRSWFLARTTGGALWLGPWFDPAGPCYACLAAVLGTNRPAERYLARRTGSRVGLTGSYAHSSIHDQLLAGLVALETIRRLCEPDSSPPTLRVVDLLTACSADHPVRQRPQCPVCGEPDLQTTQMTTPPLLDGAPGNGPTTLADLRRLVSPVTGPISAVRPMQSGLTSTHAATAFSGFGGDASDLLGFKNSVISQGAGVGTTPEEAEFGAICEAIERYSCLTVGDEPFVLAAYAELDPATTLRPEACLLYSERQYARRTEINRRGAAFDIVPEPFDEHTRIAWTGVWSLSANRFKLVPSTYLFYYFPQTSGPYCWADSNGCAAGASLADAVTRGLLELIERDCVALWWYNRLRRPGFRLDVVGEGDLTGVTEAYRGLGRDIWALDLTADLGVPTFAAISRRVDSAPEDIVMGFGADLEPRRALRHAVLEMNHILPAVLPSARTREGDYSYPEAAQKEWWRTATAANQPHLLPSAWFDELPHAALSETSSAGDSPLAHLLGVIEAAGLEVLMMDMTRPDVGLPVAKVIVPGLRHFWARLAPGRLYDVPVTLGWLQQPTPEESLNPIAMFL